MELQNRKITTRTKTMQINWRACSALLAGSCLIYALLTSVIQAYPVQAGSDVDVHGHFETEMISMPSLLNGGDSKNETVISVVINNEGTIIYYRSYPEKKAGKEFDQTPQIKKILGDGNVKNGAPRGCLSDECDIIRPGDVIDLEDQNRPS